jgi:UDP-N-acetylmuramoyl-tripeptide--D-alanyl-D-alanine ligase
MNNLYTSQDITTATKGRLIGPDDWHANRLVMDSREVQAGDIFIALKGEAGTEKYRTSGLDGHDFVGSAIDSGAVTVIVDHEMDIDIPQIIVENTFQAMQDLGQYARNRVSLKPSIAITGSVGKTTVRDMVETAFRGADAATHASVKSYNNMIGVPYTLANMHGDTQVGVFEIGMNHANEITPLSHQVRPDIAIITWISEQHIENFDDGMDGIVNAKSEIFAGMGAEGIAILPIDNEYYDALVNNAKTSGIEKIYTFGRHQNADGRLVSITTKDGVMHIEAAIMGDPVSYTLNVMGDHMAVNSLCALLALKLSGYDVHAGAKALSQIKPLQGRGTIEEIVIKDGEPPITLIDDSYNAAPVAVEMALKNLGTMTPKGEGRRIAMIGRMAELGNYAMDMHKGLAKPFMDANIDILYCCGADSEHLFNAIPTTHQGMITDTSTELAHHIKDIVRAGDIVLVKGSFGIKMGEVVNAIRALSYKQ